MEILQQQPYDGGQVLEVPSGSQTWYLLWPPQKMEPVKSKILYMAI